MKHSDPGQANVADNRLWHVASARLSLSEALPGAVLGARPGSVPGGNVVNLAPQSKRFFARLKCGGFMAGP
jgi:hypothetical protein